MCGKAARRAFRRSRNRRPEAAEPACGGLPCGRRGRDAAGTRPFAAGKPGFYANCALFTGRDYGILNY